MTEATTSQLHSVTALFKEGSAKLAEHLAQQASLKSELDRSAKTCSHAEHSRSNWSPLAPGSKPILSFR
jgi:hypothetical protein